MVYVDGPTIDAIELLPRLDAMHQGLLRVATALGIRQRGLRLGTMAGQPLPRGTPNESLLTLAEN